MLLGLFMIFLSGFVFTIGLAISGMVMPQKVIGFLDVAGNWDPSLGLVMISSVAVYLLLHQRVLRRVKPVFEERFHVPSRNDIDRPLVLGAVLFGIGWGTVGLCPGPALAALVTGHTPALIFFAAMILGMYVEGSLDVASRMWTSNNDTVDA